MDQEVSSQKRRGKAAKPAMIHVNLRLPEEVLDFFKEQPQHTLAMRQVLVAHYLQSTLKGGTI